MATKDSAAVLCRSEPCSLMPLPMTALWIVVKQQGLVPERVVLLQLSGQWVGVLSGVAPECYPHLCPRRCAAAS